MNWLEIFASTIFWIALPVGAVTGYLLADWQIRRRQRKAQQAYWDRIGRPTPAPDSTPYGAPLTPAETEALRRAWRNAPPPEYRKR